MPHAHTACAGAQPSPEGLVGLVGGGLPTALAPRPCLPPACTRGAQWRVLCHSLVVGAMCHPYLRPPDTPCLAFPLS